MAVGTIFAVFTGRKLAFYYADPTNPTGPLVCACSEMPANRPYPDSSATTDARFTLACLLSWADSEVNGLHWQQWSDKAVQVLA